MVDAEKLRLSQTMGQVAYEAYWIYCGGRSMVTHEELPSWHALGLNIQAAWNCAAKIVYDRGLAAGVGSGVKQTLEGLAQANDPQRVK